MWQYRNYSDELYHHKYIERINVPGGGYRYVYPDDKKGSGGKSGSTQVTPVTRTRNPIPDPHSGSKARTAPASSHPFRKKAGKGNEIFVRDMYNKYPPRFDNKGHEIPVKPVENETSGEKTESSSGFFDKALDKAKGIINGILDGVNKNVVDPIEAEIWSKKFNMPKELLPAYDGKHAKLPKDVKKRKKEERPSTGSKAQTR